MKEAMVDPYLRCWKVIIPIPSLVAKTNVALPSLEETNVMIPNIPTWKEVIWIESCMPFRHDANVPSL